LDTVILGRTGLEVSVAGLGGGGKSRLGRAQGKDHSHSVALVRAAMDSGITLIDTAARYGTEGIIGEAIRGRRDEVVISTKVGINFGGHDDTEKMIDAAELTRRVEERLVALGIDCIDILHLHALSLDQYDHCVKELVPALNRLKKSGKIRFTGLTERFVVDTSHQMLMRAAQDDFWDVFMIGFNYVNQSAIGKVLPATRERNIGTLCMFAVRGPLSTLDSANALVARLIASGEIDPAEVTLENPLGFLADPGVGKSLTEVAYRFCRHTPGIDVVVTGTGNPEHLRQNIHALNAPPLDSHILERLQHIFGRVISESCEPSNS